MKPLLVLLATALLSVSACSCGDTDTGANSTPPASRSTHANDSTTTSSESPLANTKADGDKDNDVEAANDDKQNTSILNFGHVADASDQQRITALIKHYYAAALAENGAKGCSMIYSPLAESIPENYSGTPGVPYMQGAKTCAAAMTLLYKHYHPLLVLEVPKLKVVDVRLKEHHGIALLSFGKLPERETSFSREGHVWKMTMLLDTELT